MAQLLPALAVCAVQDSTGVLSCVLTSLHVVVVQSFPDAAAEGVHDWTNVSPFTTWHSVFVQRFKALAASAVQLATGVQADIVLPQNTPLAGSCTQVVGSYATVVLLPVHSARS